MKHVFIAAEAGVNHNGCLETAKRLIDTASDVGVDGIKFQTYKTQAIVSKHAGQASYQTKNTGKQMSQYEMLKQYEMDLEFHTTLISHCKSKNIKFFSTPFDIDSIELLDKLGMDLIKISSSEVTNYPYLKKIGSLKKSVILSTGMSDLGMIEAALSVLTQEGTSLDNITVLHANTEYPTPMQDVNLRAMQTIEKAFGVKVGYSDHTNGIEVPIAAVALGACVIEKHFTLDRNMEGPDHLASTEPEEFKQMVQAIRNISTALGSSIKQVTPSEQKNIFPARKSLTAIEPIQVGELFTEKNLGIKRPGNGLNPMLWNQIIGKKSNKNYAIDELITL